MWPKGNIKEVVYKKKISQNVIFELSAKETPDFWCLGLLQIWTEQNGWREKLGIFSAKHALPIPHPCCQENSADAEGQLAFFLMVCFKNKTEETIHFLLP